MRGCLTLSLAVMMAAPLAAQETTGHEFKVGASDQLEVVDSYSIAQKHKSRRRSASASSTLLLNQTVKEVSKAGTATIEMRFDVVKVKRSELGGRSMAFDSTDPASVEKARLNPELKSLVQLPGTVITLKVTRRGSVVSAKSPHRNGLYGSSSDWHRLFMQWAPTTLSVGDRWTTSYRVFADYARLKFRSRHDLAAVTGEQWTIKTRLTADVDVIKPPSLQAARVTITKAEGKQTSVVLPGQGRLESIDEEFALNLTYSIGRGGPRLWLTQEIVSKTRCRRLGPGKPAPRPKPVRRAETKPKPTRRRRPKPAAVKLDPLEAALIARHVKRLGTPSPNKTTDPEGWTSARKIRKKAAVELEAIGAKALPALRKASQDPENKTLRTWAAYVIRKIEKGRIVR